MSETEIPLEQAVEMYLQISRQQRIERVKTDLPPSVNDGQIKDFLTGDTEMVGSFVERYNSFFREITLREMAFYLSEETSNNSYPDDDPEGKLKDYQQAIWIEAQKNPGLILEDDLGAIREQVVRIEGQGKNPEEILK